MPMRVVEITTLDPVAGFALLKNPQGKPSATFNITLNQPKTQGTCRQINGIQGTIALDTATTTDLLTYAVGVEFQFHWMDDIVVKSVDVTAL
jgi:hypothetical protein